MKANSYEQEAHMHYIAYPPNEIVPQTAILKIA